MLRSVELLKKIYDKLLNDVARENDLTVNELKILMFLNNGSENNIAKNIADGLGSTKSHVSLSVSNLEQKGYIEKIQDESDKKKSHLCLTQKSEKVIEVGKNVQTKIKDIILDGITEEEINILTNISNKMKDNLEKYNKN